MSLFDRGEMRLYFEHVLALVRPGHRPVVPDVYGVSPGTLESWNDLDLDLMLEEGRRELDAAASTLNDLRARGQTLFTILLAFVGFSVGGQFISSVDKSILGYVLWYVGLVVTVVGLVGAAAVYATTAEMGSVDAVLLSREPSAGIKRIVACAYPHAVKRSKVTTMARFTVLRDATWFGVIGALLVLASWGVMKVS